MSRLALTLACASALLACGLHSAPAVAQDAPLPVVSDEAIYLSGWQVAADANTAGQMYPDQSLYPANSVPEVVRRINRCLARADQIAHMEGDTKTNWFLPIVADAEAGFGGVLNAYENYFMVKNSDAHAWSEVFENGAWQRFDATPGAMTSSAQAEAMRAARAEDSSWDARFDSLRVLWYRRIVNFDQRAQAEMIEKVRGLTVDTGGAIREVLNELSAQLKAWIKRPWDLRRVSRTTFWIVMAGGLVWALARMLPWLWL